MTSKDDKACRVKEEIWTGVRKNPGIGEVVLYGAPPPTPWDQTIPYPIPALPEPNDESRKFVEKLIEEAAKTRHEKQAIPKADLDLRMRELIDEIRCFRKAMERHADAIGAIVLANRIIVNEIAKKKTKKRKRKGNRK